jgi:hypothetical protein
MLLVIIAATSFMLLSNASKKTTATGECPASREKSKEPQVQGDGMIWESVSRHLLTVANQ